MSHWESPTASSVHSVTGKRMGKSPSMDEEPMGDDAYRDVRGALESTASRTHTTHSSPCDVDDDDAALPRPEAQGMEVIKSPKYVVGDFYQSVETPRATPRRTSEIGGSIRSIHIQVEGAHPRSQPSEIATAHTPASGRRPPFCGISSRRTGAEASGSIKKVWDGQCRTISLQALTLLALPTLVLLLLKYSVAYVMLCVLNVVVALASWEWSWWSFRIRQRLLVSFQSMHEQHAPTTREELEDRQDHAMNQDQSAIAMLMSKCFGRSRSYNKYLCAGLASLLPSAALVSLVMVFADSIVTHDRTVLGERVLFASALTSSFSALVCACLSPAPADAVIVFVYQACFVVSSLNSFLAHHEHVVHDPELLDSMYVLLVGACAVVVWRIVSSKDVMESTIMALLDFLGLAYLIAPMMAMADFLGHPTVNTYGDVVGTFFVVVSAAEAAYRLNDAVKQAYPRFLARFRRPLVKNVSHSLGIESLVLSIVFGLLGSLGSIKCFHGYSIRWQDGLVYLGAVVMSQLCRLALESMKTMAKVDTRSHVVKYQPWIAGVLELLNPYLLAMIVFHPYVKALIKQQKWRV